MGGTNHTSKSAFSRFFSLLKLDKSDILFLYLYAFLGTLLGLALPIGIQSIIGLIANGQTSTSWLVLIGGVTVCIILVGILKIMQLRITEVLQQRIFVRSAFDFAYRIPRFKMETILKQYPPELMNRFFDTLTLQKGVSKILLDFSGAIFDILIGLAVISFYNSFFAFFAIISLFILILLMRFTFPYGFYSSIKESSYKYEVAHWLEELARAMTTFKIAGNTELPLSRNDENVMQYLKYRNEHFRILQIQYGLMIVFKAALALALLLGGSYLVLNGQLSIGQFVGAELLMLNIMAAIEKLILGIDNVYDVLTALEKLGAVMDIELENHQGIDFKNVVTDNTLGIDIENLDYQYTDDSKLTLSKVQFSILPSEKICIAGFGGSGKSTLLRILNGSFSNFKGSILYNGIPIQDIEYSSMQEKMGDISAQEDIFNGTLLENISVGRVGIELKMVVDIAREIGLLPFIQKLPNGFNTMLNAEGRMLPSSVKQKIIIARSIINDPAMVMMDTGLQELDTETAERIADFLTNKKQKWTLITVSNEIIFAKRCDKVIVMREGQVIDIGTYDEISKKDYFNSLFV